MTNPNELANDMLAGGYVSNCCGAPTSEDCPICSDCREWCEAISEEELNAEMEEGERRDTNKQEAKNDH